MGKKKKKIKIVIKTEDLLKHRTPHKPTRAFEDKRRKKEEKYQRKMLREEGF